MVYGLMELWYGNHQTVRIPSIRRSSEDKVRQLHVLDHKRLASVARFKVKRSCWYQTVSNRTYSKPTLANLSVEEENLAAIPFAVLERRVGKVSKIEISGTKYLPDGSEVQVTWQVQGNQELGLPTEQDLDIFVVLGMLTFANNFSKTVSFSGRQIAKMLNISGVHGKFYQRLKLAMDRFISLRFRAIAITEQQEDVKWLNIFQECYFSLDHRTGKCTGSVTWTDRLIQAMNSGFFRVLDGGRYMELDGLTAKHLYRFLAVEFDKTDLVVIDARKLCQQHLGILTPPQYLSRLMQTLEPAFEQLQRIQVIGSYHIVSSADWSIALQRHPEYVSARKTLLSTDPAGVSEIQLDNLAKTLEAAGFTQTESVTLTEDCAESRLALYRVERALRILEAMKIHSVMQYVAVGLLRNALNDPSADILDWCEIAVEVCRQKQEGGQKLRNAGGFIVKLIKDPEARRRAVSESAEAAWKDRFRQRMNMALKQEEEHLLRSELQNYERFRHEEATRILEIMPEERRKVLRREKSDVLKQQGRFDRIAPDHREAEIDNLILIELARTEAPPYEKWFIRKRVQQTLLPFGQEDLPFAPESIAG